MQAAVIGVPGRLDLAAFYASDESRAVVGWHWLALLAGNTPFQGGPTHLLPFGPAVRLRYRTAHTRSCSSNSCRYLGPRRRQR